MANPSPLDPQILEQLRLLEVERPGLMKELIRLFVADAPKQMRLIDGAYTRRDPEMVRQCSHFLRSGSLALGLNTLAAQAHHIEHLDLADYGSKDVDARVVALRAELHSVLLALLKIMKNGA
jgi:HPt (histidine-containing phosphotransfer) domain-containing protein